MTIHNSFLHLEHKDLIVIQRLCQAAKFGLTNDTELNDSPNLDAIYRQVLAALIAYDYQHNGTSKVNAWVEWLKVDTTRDEWKFVVAKFKADELFIHYSEYTQHLVIRQAMLPFDLTDEQAQSIVDEIRHEAD
jgi:hypothetical protein